MWRSDLPFDLLQALTGRSKRQRETRRRIGFARKPVLKQKSQPSFGAHEARGATRQALVPAARIAYASLLAIAAADAIAQSTA